MSATRTRLKRPWHLFPEDERDIATRMIVMCSSENPRDGNVPPPEAWMRDINDAILAVLRAAAPYPDEALAFSAHLPWVCDMHVQLVGITHGSAVTRGQPIVEDECGEVHVTHWECLRPLTIAAQEALEMF